MPKKVFYSLFKGCTRINHVEGPFITASIPDSTFETLHHPAGGLAEPEVRRLQGLEETWAA
jgi:hypothetical protein